MDIQDFFFFDRLHRLNFIESNRIDHDDSRTDSNSEPEWCFARPILRSMGNTNHESSYEWQDNPKHNFQETNNSDMISH